MFQCRGQVKEHIVSFEHFLLGFAQIMIRDIILWRYLLWFDVSEELMTGSNSDILKEKNF